MQIHDKNNYKRRDKDRIDVLERFLWILWRKEVEFKTTLN